MQLTKAEEQVMQHLWDMGEGLVKDIRDRFDEPKPVRNTVSTVLRILERKILYHIKPTGTCMFIILWYRRTNIQNRSFSA